jgi:hypothetical protein
MVEAESFHGCTELFRLKLSSAVILRPRGEKLIPKEQVEVVQAYVVAWTNAYIPR